MKRKKFDYDLLFGGSARGKTASLQEDFNMKYYLSTEGYYFKYRPDRNDSSIIRATLYRTKDNSRVDDVRVSAGYGFPHKSHHGVINHFEARLTLNIIE